MNLEPTFLFQEIQASQAGVQRRAKAITLLKSTRDDHRVQADELLNSLLPLIGTYRFILDA